MVEDGITTNNDISNGNDPILTETADMFRFLDETTHPAFCPIPRFPASAYTMGTSKQNRMESARPPAGEGLSVISSALVRAFVVFRSGDTIDMRSRLHPIGLEGIYSFTIGEQFDMENYTFEKSSQNR